MKAKTALIFPDPHFAPKGCPAGGVDPKAESVARQAIAIVKPDIFVCLGDLIEGHSISHWKYQKVKRPPLEYQLADLEPELKAGNDGLDKWDQELDKVGCNARHMTWGNHDGRRLDDFLLAYPYLSDKYSADIAFKMKARGYKTYPYGEYMKLGKLRLYHGGHVNTAHVERDHAMRLGASVMFGHYHSVGYARVAHIDGPNAAWNMGCLCLLKKDFMQGKPVSWGHSLGIVHLESNGDFRVEVCDILDGVGYVYGHKVVAK